METIHTPSSQSPATARELRHYLNILRKRWRILAAAVIASGAIAFVYTIRQPKIYGATCSVVIESSAPRVLEGVRDVIDMSGEGY